MKHLVIRNLCERDLETPKIPEFLIVPLPSIYAYSVRLNRCVVRIRKLIVTNSYLTSTKQQPFTSLYMKIWGFTFIYLAHT